MMMIILHISTFGFLDSMERVRSERRNPFVVIEHNNEQSDAEHSHGNSQTLQHCTHQRINSFPPIFCSAIHQQPTSRVERDKFRARLLQVVSLNTNEGYDKRQTTGQRGEKRTTRNEGRCVSLDWFRHLINRCNPSDDTKFSSILCVTHII